MATTRSPTWSVSEFPTASGWRSEEGAATTTAKSFEALLPTTVAG